MTGNFAGLFVVGRNIESTGTAFQSELLFPDKIACTGNFYGNFIVCIGKYRSVFIDKSDFYGSKVRAICSNGTVIRCQEDFLGFATPPPTAPSPPKLH